VYLQRKVILSGSVRHFTGRLYGLPWPCAFMVSSFFGGDKIHGIQSLNDIQVRIDKYLHPINISGLSFDEALSVYKNNLGLEYLTGYLIEKALSVDNIFVMIMIFYAFGVDERYYKRVLMWGVLGAVVMRFVFIFGSAAMIQQFSWILYIPDIYRGKDVYQQE